MAKKKKKNGNGNTHSEKRTLEIVIATFQEKCPQCNGDMVAHAYRPKRPPRGKEMVYASCLNKGKCGRAGLEVCYMGYYN